MFELAGAGAAGDVAGGDDIDSALKEIDWMERLSAGDPAPGLLRDAAIRLGTEPVARTRGDLRQGLLEGGRQM